MPFNTKQIGISIVLAAAVVTVVVTVAVVTTRNSMPESLEEAPQSAEQKVIRILERMPIIDGHNDFPWNLRKLVFNDLRNVNFSSDLAQDPVWGNHPESFTDIPRLRKGHVGGQFWVAYTSCASNYKDSVEQTLEQIDVIHRLAAAYPDDLYLAKSSADIETAIANGKIASLIAIEGGHSIQSSFAILRLMYNMGARYMTLTHSCNLPWADASPVDAGTIPPANNGLSEFGLKMIDEMNRLGMMVDLSHVSVATMKASINRSKAPVIFSHSNAKVVCPHHRNVPDDVLEMVKTNNGIVMVNFYKSFVQCDSGKNATIEDVILHIEHIRNVCGVDCLGIGADYDGVDEVPIDLPDVSSYPALFEALMTKGWIEEDLEKLAGRNLLRVFKDVERVRDELVNTPMNQDVIRKQDVDRAGINTTCVTAPFIDDFGNKIKDDALNKTGVVIENGNEIITDENLVVNRTRRHVLSYEESGDL